MEEGSKRERFLNLILSEYERTQIMFAMLYGGPLEEKRPQVHRVLELRWDALRVLHQQQLGLLREWCSHQKARVSGESETLLTRLLVTVNAIASGLRTTG